MALEKSRAVTFDRYAVGFLGAAEILIVEGQGEPIGLLVDQVADTIDVSPGDIHPAPPNVNGVQSRHLRGVCRNGSRLVALLDLAAVLQTATDSGQVNARELTTA